MAQPVDKIQIDHFEIVFTSASMLSSLWDPSQIIILGPRQLIITNLICLRMVEYLSFLNSYWPFSLLHKVLLLSDYSFYLML